MIRLTLETEPVVCRLKGQYAGASVTLRRLTTPEFRDAQARAQALLRDPERLSELLVRHNLVKSARDLKTAIVNPAAMTGIGEWIGCVECAVEAVADWTGFADGEGAPVAVSREALEVAMLDEHLASQLMGEIDRVARILVVEAGFSGPSVTGGAAALPKAGGETESEPTPEGPAGAPTAVRPATPARRAARTRRGGPVPRSQTDPAQ